MSMRTRMLSAAGLALMTAIAVAVWSFGGVQAQEAEPTEPAVVETGTTMLTVRGVATRALTPDQTTIQFEVSALDETARNAVRAGDRALRAIQSRLRAYRVSDDQLHTRRVSLRRGVRLDRAGPRLARLPLQPIADAAGRRHRSRRSADRPDRQRRRRRRLDQQRQVPPPPAALKPSARCCSPRWMTPAPPPTRWPLRSARKSSTPSRSPSPAP